MVMRPSVIMLAQLKKVFSAPKISTRMNATTLTPTCRWIALSGVCRLASTLPSAPGRTPERPMPNQVRVPPLKQAIETAMAEFSRANSSSTQAPPQTRCASVVTGKGMSKLILLTWSTPKPTR
jgi:hypothetical protein